MEAHTCVEDVGSFVKILRELAAGGTVLRPTWFRGHSNANFRLQASALRDQRFRNHESWLVKRFMQDALTRLPELPRGSWDPVLLAQHHGVPTRLLDWSENALVALFFACEGHGGVLQGMPQPDGSVWVLMPATLNQTVGTWTGIHTEDLPLLDVDPSLDKYNPMSLTPAQEPLRHVAVLAARTFPRIINQWGTFTVTGDLVAMEDLEHADKFLVRIDVRADAKAEILRELSSLGVDERFVYPDLHRLGSRVKELIL